MRGIRENPSRGGGKTDSDAAWGQGGGLRREGLKLWDHQLGKKGEKGTKDYCPKQRGKGGGRKASSWGNNKAKKLLSRKTTLANSGDMNLWQPKYLGNNGSRVKRTGQKGEELEWKERNELQAVNN